MLSLNLPSSNCFYLHSVLYHQHLSISGKEFLWRFLHLFPNLSSNLLLFDLFQHFLLLVLYSRYMLSLSLPSSNHFYYHFVYFLYHLSILGKLFLWRLLHLFPNLSSSLLPSYRFWHFPLLGLDC